MIPDSKLPCWDIMNCNPDKICPARQNTEKPCWEIAEEFDDYRKAFNVCVDCIVYLLKNGNSVLSEKEINILVKQRADCSLA